MQEKGVMQWGERCPEVVESMGHKGPDFSVVGGSVQCSRPIPGALRTRPHPGIEYRRCQASVTEIEVLVCVTMYGPVGL